MLCNLMVLSADSQTTIGNRLREGGSGTNMGIQSCDESYGDQRGSCRTQICVRTRPSLTSSSTTLKIIAFLQH